MRYVVNVLHSGGHGPDAYVALVTEDLVQAVDTAMQIESFGYTIGGECAATVLKMEEGAVYSKPKPNESDSKSVLFSNYRPFSWREPLRQKWFNREAESLYNRLKSSQPVAG